MTTRTRRPRHRPDFPLIARAIVGDRATLPDLKNRFVRSHCDAPETAMLACLSCRQPIANLLQLLFHLEGAAHQTHVIARQCLEHGWEAL